MNSSQRSVHRIGPIKIHRRLQFFLLILLSMAAGGLITVTLYGLTTALTTGHTLMDAEIGQNHELGVPAGSEGYLDLSGKQLLPAYVDLNIGDHLQIRRNSGRETHLLVKLVLAERNSSATPRTKVVLEIDGKTVEAYCGMLHPKLSGIAPVKAGGIMIGVEVTRRVFSRITRKKTFNSYVALRLSKDVRLAIWDPNQPIMAAASGIFIVDQPDWTRECFGNWLCKTPYGLHSGIDIFATTSGVPQKVKSPVDGVCFVYHKDAPEDSETIQKHVNIYSTAEVGPRKEKILFRFLHLSRILVENGERVRQGQVIGLTGHTGFKAHIGDHLHFEIRLNPSLIGMEFNDDILASIPVNPYPFLLEWWHYRGEHYAEPNRHP